jgi:toxin FitB
VTSWILDTNIVSELRKPRPSRPVLDWLRATGSDNLFLSTITFAEIRYGIEIQHDPDLRARLAIWLDTAVRPMFEGRVVVVNEDVLLDWRLLGKVISKQKRTVPEPDLLLCAVARHYRMKIVSRDIKHIKASGVPVLNPWTGERFNGA